MTFQKELEGLINKCCKENDSDTPDFILAEYVNNCLNNFADAVRSRDKYYDFKPWKDDHIQLGKSGKT